MPINFELFLINSNYAIQKCSTSFILFLFIKRIIRIDLLFITLDLSHKLNFISKFDVLSARTCSHAQPTNKPTRPTTKQGNLLSNPAQVYKVKDKLIETTLNS